jgi:hypothetical protein
MGQFGWAECQILLFLLDRLAQDVQDVAVKLGELVEEEDAVVSQADFPGTRHRPSADAACVRDRMVRSAKRARTDEDEVIAGLIRCGGFDPWRII